MARINGTSAKNNYGFYALLTETLGTNYLNTNTTTVKYEVYIVNVNARTESGNWTFNAKIDGSNVYNKTGQTLKTNDVAYNKAKLVFSGSKDVKHENNGSKTITFSASLTKSSAYSAYDPGKCSLSGDVILTTIPRASTIEAVSGYIGETTTLYIGRKSDSFTEKLTWSCEKLSGTIENLNNETNVPFTIPTSLYALIPNDKQIDVTISCITYNGTTQVGEEQTTTLTARVDETKNKPIINEPVITETNTKVSNLTNKLVLNASRPKITINASGQNGASIKSIITTNKDGQSYSGDDVVFNTIGTAKFTIDVTDTRDLPNSKQIDKTEEAIPYVQPNIKTISIDRLSPTSGEIILSLIGSFYKGYIDKTENELNISYRYKENVTNATWSDLIRVPNNSIDFDTTNNSYSLTDFSLGQITQYNKQYAFEIYYSDVLVTDTKPLTRAVKKGVPTFDYGEHDLKVNGDLFVADEDGLNKINILDKIKELQSGDIDLSDYATKKELEDYAKSADLSTVATTGKYYDLLDEPTVEDSLESTSTTNSLSANQGRVLQEQIDDAIGQFDLVVQTITSQIPTDNSQLTNGAGYQTATQVNNAVSTKQDKLVSGTNIKTINNTTILGSGNISIPSGKDGIGIDTITNYYLASEIGGANAITWDGDTTGRQEFDMGEAIFYKVSGRLITMEEMVGKTISIYSSDGTGLDYVLTPNDIVPLGDGYIYILYQRQLPVMMLITESEVENENGVYSIKMINGNNVMYISSLELGGDSITIDTAGWTETPQTITSTKKYLWNYEKITYTDNTSFTSEPHIIGVYGDTGVGIESVVQTTTSTEDGGTNIITVTKTDGTTSTFSVKNGSAGSSGGGSGGNAVATDVQVNGTSITSNGVANLITESAYNSSTNKIATKNDIPTNNNQLTNGAGYLTEITGQMVKQALGYVPYSTANPNGFQNATQVEQAIDKAIPDSGWITATLTSSFKAYGDDSLVAPAYRKVGKVVEITGQVAPTGNIASGGNANIFTLPEGYRPSKTRYTLCQGSGKNFWLLTVYYTGEVNFSRYGTNANAQCPTSAWLPFNMTFTVD